MPTPPKNPAGPKGAAPSDTQGERIAKVLSRAGIASRREAERMIQLGQVAVNGKVIDSPALNVSAQDRITVEGRPVGQPEPARLWLYYKPEGLVTSAADEKGRETIFDHMPEDLPRVMSVGRLDLNSEGLLLLTNDGGLKRKLELPSTGWLRKYRVRVKGTPMDPDLDPLRQGITVDGDKFQPMIVSLDRVQGANAWLTVGLREGKNREIRRAMQAVGLTVNRLIRVSYGPFRLGDMEPGEVAEVKGRVLRDQLGQSELPEDAVADPKDRRPPPRGTARPAAKSGPRPTGRPAETSARSAEKGPPKADAKPGRPRDPARPPAHSAGRSAGRKAVHDPAQASAPDAPARAKPASTKGWAKAAPRKSGSGVGGGKTAGRNASAQKPGPAPKPDTPKPDTKGK